MIPYAIRTIVQQVGGCGVHGALAYVGADHLCFKCPPSETEYRPSQRSEVMPNGLLSYEVGLAFRVNGKRRQHWTMLIAYEPDDTYTVYLWRRPSRTQLIHGIAGLILDQCDQVYCDTLRSTVEQMYDRAIRKYCNGFIPL
jgi:hypothetical protein